MKRIALLFASLAALALCSTASFAQGTCFTCDQYAYCQSNLGTSAWCLSVYYPESGIRTCDQGGDCSIGGGGGEDIPPRHHFAPGTNDEDRQATVRQIIASTTLTPPEKAKLLIEYAMPQEISAWCDVTPGCIFSFNPDAPTPTKLSTWGRLKILYR